MSEKDEIINKIYFDKSGYGSVLKTYKDAKEKYRAFQMVPTS